MHKFILLYKGPVPQPDASHEGWPEWFAKIGDKLVDRGSPMLNGQVIETAGLSTDKATSLNGYSIIQAEDCGAVQDLLKDHPYLTQGEAYTIEIFELA